MTFANINAQCAMSLGDNPNDPSRRRCLATDGILRQRAPLIITRHCRSFNKFRACPWWSRSSLEVEIRVSLGARARARAVHGISTEVRVAIAVGV